MNGEAEKITVCGCDLCKEVEDTVRIDFEELERLRRIEHVYSRELAVRPSLPRLYSGRTNISRLWQHF